MNRVVSLAPSSAARRVRCPGSRALEARYPADFQNEAAKEGSAAHWLAQEFILNLTNSTWKPPSKSYNGVEVTDEMLEGAELYAEDICNVLESRYGEIRIDDLKVEEDLDISVIHPGCKGKPDCWLFHAGYLYLWDYKYGRRAVEVYENWQLLEYAAGILNLITSTSTIRDTQIQVVFCIVQPRGFHPDGPVRKWQVRASDLRAHFNTLHSAEHEAAKEVADCKVSSECQYCSARHACRALQDAALHAVDLAYTNTPFDLSADQTGNELRYLLHAKELLEARITGLEEQATAMIKRGDRVPHFSLQAKKGRKSWTVPDEQVFALGDMMQVPLRQNPRPVTPAQAIKLKLDPTIVDSMSEIPVRGMKLVPYEKMDAKKIFGGKK